MSGLQLPPLSLYVHIPWCQRKCPYCDFNSHAANSALPESEYVDALMRHLEPDLSFVRSDRLELATTNYFNGPPDLAVEIISKGTRKLDYERKKPAYEQAGTRELWIIDYLLEEAHFFCQENNRFAQPPLERRRYFPSRVLPGFRLDVHWLWSDPLPKPTPILKRLLK